MERRYREVTLKRKKRSLQVLSGSVMLVILLKLVGGTPGNLLEQMVQYGTNYIRPAIFKFQESYYKSKPTFLGMIAPRIFAYMEQSGEPEFVVEDMAVQDLEGEQSGIAASDTERIGDLYSDTQAGSPASDIEPVSGAVSTAGQGIEEDTYAEQNTGVLESANQNTGVQETAEPVHLAFSQETELALLQENIYTQREEDQSMLLKPNELIASLKNESGTQPADTVQNYDITKYYDMEQLIKDFYIVDASTSPDASLLNIEELTSYDCTLDKNAAGPQILIYHSHSQEDFADSVPGDKSTTIVGAGERLTQLLEEEYGYDVLHHEGVYDVPTRDNAYSNALPDIEQVLADNPTIQVVIDLHRDAVAEGTKLVTIIDGKDYARFMFFNGICRSTNGPITYLNNPYLQENLAFSFQAQRVAESYFPGVTRKIYLKAWRYNMHFVPRNMLIELGAQTNTVEEIMNTTEILAFVIDKVLSGQ
ncbi:MAG: stage II sporulation protein P [Lachnospiraceae bacterium]|nr:stage II sporulation protein P [Lachnospiraceae bacterium]